MFRKTIKKVTSVILAFALMTAYVPMVAVAAEGQITAESYQEQLDKVAAAEEELLEAKAALAAAEEKLAAEAENSEALAEKNEAETAKLEAETALAAAKAELDDMQSELIEARFYVQTAYDGDKAIKKECIGTGLAFRNTNGSYEIITMPENVRESIESGAIEEVSRGKSADRCSIDYRYTDTSVTAMFYVLKEDKTVPTDEITSQSKSNYNLVGSGTINTGRRQIFGESSIPSEIQDFQFDFLNNSRYKYVWYVVKFEFDGWHVDGYIVTEEETTTVPEEETTTVPEEETTTAPEEETTTAPEEETTTAPEEETTTAPEEETTTAPEEETTTAPEEETTTAPEEETTTAPEEETTTAPEEETTTVNFEDEVTPLNPPTEWADFEDEETPLDAVPKTGSANLVFPAMVVSCVAIVTAVATRKKEETEE